MPSSTPATVDLINPPPLSFLQDSTSREPTDSDPPLLASHYSFYSLDADVGTIATDPEPGPSLSTPGLPLFASSDDDVEDLGLLWSDGTCQPAHHATDDGEEEANGALASGYMRHPMQNPSLMSEPAEASRSFPVFLTQETAVAANFASCDAYAQEGRVLDHRRSVSRCQTSQNENDVSSGVTSSRHCVVCGETADGFYFGALVCLPCKSFFIRCTKGVEPILTPKCEGTCNVRGSDRVRCQFCRFQRCLSAGMHRKEKPEAVVPGAGQELCRVCNDIANGVHFGVSTCEGCKKFFRRGLHEHQGYVCKRSKRCILNPRLRNSCRYCRYQRCLQMGMSREAIKMGRPKRGKNSKCFAPYPGTAEERKRWVFQRNENAEENNSSSNTSMLEKLLGHAMMAGRETPGSTMALGPPSHTGHAVTGGFLESINQQLRDLGPASNHHEWRTSTLLSQDSRCSSDFDAGVHAASSSSSSAGSVTSSVSSGSDSLDDDASSVSYFTGSSEDSFSPSQSLNQERAMKHPQYDTKVFTLNSETSSASQDDLALPSRNDMILSCLQEPVLPSHHLDPLPTQHETPLPYYQNDMVPSAHHNECLPWRENQSETYGDTVQPFQNLASSFSTAGVRPQSSPSSDDCALFACSVPTCNRNCLCYCSENQCPVGWYHQRYPCQQLDYNHCLAGHENDQRPSSVETRDSGISSIEQVTRTTWCVGYPSSQPCLQTPTPPPAALGPQTYVPVRTSRNTNSGPHMHGTAGNTAGTVAQEASMIPPTQKGQCATRGEEKGEDEVMRNEDLYNLLENFDDKPFQPDEGDGNSSAVVNVQTAVNSNNTTVKICKGLVYDALCPTSLNTRDMNATADKRRRQSDSVLQSAPNFKMRKHRSCSTVSEGRLDEESNSSSRDLLFNHSNQPYHVSVTYLSHKFNKECGWESVPNTFSSVSPSAVTSAASSAATLIKQTSSNLTGSRSLGDRSYPVQQSMRPAEATVTTISPASSHGVSADAFPSYSLSSVGNNTMTTTQNGQVANLNSPLLTDVRTVTEVSKAPQSMIISKPRFTDPKRFSRGGNNEGRSSVYREDVGFVTGGFDATGSKKNVNTSDRVLDSLSGVPTPTTASHSMLSGQDESKTRNAPGKANALPSLTNSPAPNFSGAIHDVSDHGVGRLATEGTDSPKSTNGCASTCSQTYSLNTKGIDSPKSTNTSASTGSQTYSLNTKDIDSKKSTNTSASTGSQTYSLNTKDIDSKKSTNTSASTGSQTYSLNTKGIDSPESANTSASTGSQTYSLTTDVIDSAKSINTSASTCSQASFVSRPSRSLDCGRKERFSSLGHQKEKKEITSLTDTGCNPNWTSSSYLYVNSIAASTSTVLPLPISYSGQEASKLSNNVGKPRTAKSVFAEDLSVQSGLGLSNDSKARTPSGSAASPRQSEISSPSGLRHLFWPQTSQPMKRGQPEQATDLSVDSGSLKSAYLYSTKPLSKKPLSFVSKDSMSMKDQCALKASSAIPIENHASKPVFFLPNDQQMSAFIHHEQETPVSIFPSDRQFWDSGTAGGHSEQTTNPIPVSLNDVRSSGANSSSYNYTQPLASSSAFTKNPQSLKAFFTRSSNGTQISTSGFPSDHLSMAPVSTVSRDELFLHNTSVNSNDHQSLTSVSAVVSSDGQSLMPPSIAPMTFESSASNSTSAYLSYHRPSDPTPASSGATANTEPPQRPISETGEHPDDLQETNDYFLSLGKGCEQNDCSGSGEDAILPDQLKDACLSVLCQVCLEWDRPPGPQSHVLCTRRHHRYWHGYRPRPPGVRDAGKDQRLLVCVMEAFSVLKDRLVQLLTAVGDQAKQGQNSKTPNWSAERFHQQLDTVASLSKEFMLQIPGSSAVAPEDVEQLSRRHGAGSTLILLSCQASEAQCRRLADVWGWTEVNDRTLAGLRAQLLTLTSHLRALGLDRTETALLCALALFATDVSGLKDRGAVDSLRKSLLSELETYISSRDQWFGVRVKRLFGPLPDVRLTSAWLLAVLDHLSSPKRSIPPSDS